MCRRHVFKFAPRIPHLVSTVKDDLFRRFKKTHTRARDGRRRALLLFSSVAPHEVVPARAPRQHVQRVRRLARLVQPTVQPHHRARNELFRAFIRQLDARDSRRPSIPTTSRSHRASTSHPRSHARPSARPLPRSPRARSTRRASPVTSRFPRSSSSSANARAALDRARPRARTRTRPHRTARRATSRTSRRRRRSTTCDVANRTPEGVADRVVGARGRNGKD